ncbi:MAG: hypothetical protein Q9196_005475 [Gyalolechia fulgens]
MAAVDRIVLSSSSIPRTAVTTPPLISQNAISSSPALPSPSQILMGKPPNFQSGSAAILPPNDANRGSISVTSLLRSPKTNEMMSPITSDALRSLKTSVAIQTLHRAAAGGGKRDATRGQVIGRPKKVKGTRPTGTRSNSKTPPDLTFAQVTTNVNDESSALDKKNAQKSRKGDQSTIRRTKITKPGASTAASKRSKNNATADAPEIPDVVCEDQASSEKAKEMSLKQNDHDLGLLEASRRRKDWTPAKRIVGKADYLNDAETAWSTLIPCESPSTGKFLDAGFGKLVRDFGYADAEKMSIDRNYASRDLGEECCTKRRKLDLVSGIALTAPETIPPKRSRSPKKKPQTITDKATAPFIPERKTTTSIRSYFTNPLLNTDSRCSDRVSVIEKPAGKSGTDQLPPKTPAKATKKKARVPKNTKRPAKLLSPESALETTNAQDLLFGTSSQLAREESPTFMRNLQQAVRESEIADDTKSSPRGNESQITAQSTTSNVSSSTLPTGSRNMWAVAARDGAGSLLQVDVVDLVETPQPSRSMSTATNVIEVQGQMELPSTFAQTAVDEGWKIAQDVTKKESSISLAVDPHNDESVIPRSVAEASLRERPRSRSPVKKSRKRKDSEISVTDKVPPEMPKYSSLSYIELNKAAAAFGFKPIRRREELIPLLETCWKSKNRIALQSLPPNVSGTVTSSKEVAEEKSELGSPTKRRGRPPKETSAESKGKGAKAKSSASPRKPRGRPKKSTAAELPRSTKLVDGPLDEISDAGSAHPTPSPPRRAPAKVSRPLALTGSSAAAAAARASTTLLPIITEAIIKNQPTHDANNLTWHEKMLLYDPIVVEDLADWLNREGLGHVGCTEVVSPVMVKQWCESQSVCCLWKDNLKGGKRARH